MSGEGTSEEPTEPVKRVRIRKGNSVWIHSKPDKEKASRVPHPARGGDSYEILGEKNGMYLVARGWISSNEKYVEVVPC